MRGYQDVIFMGDLLYVTFNEGSKFQQIKLLIG